MKKVKSNACQILLMASIFLIEFSNYAQNISIIAPIKNYLFYLGLYLTTLNMVLTIFRLKLNFKSIITILILLTYSLIISYITSDDIFIELFSFIIVAINISFDELIEKDFKIRIFTLIFILTFYLLGFAIKTTFYRDGQIKHAFGFNNTNTFAFFCLTMFLEYIYIQKDKINTKKLIISTIIGFTFIKLTGSRSSEISIILFILLYLIAMKRQKFKKSRVVDIITSNLFIILTVLSYIVTNDFIHKVGYTIELNKFLSSRLWMQRHYILNYPINIFGNKLNYIFTIDNVYIKTLMNFGLAGTIIMNHFYSKILKTAKEKKDKVMYCIAIVLLFYGLMEWYIIRPVLNIFLFYYSSYLFKKVGEKNER